MSGRLAAGGTGKNSAPAKGPRGITREAQDWSGRMRLYGPVHFVEGFEKESRLSAFAAPPGRDDTTV